MNTLQSKITPTHNYTMRRGKSMMQKGGGRNRKYSHTVADIKTVPVQFLYSSVKGDSSFIKLPNGLLKLVPNTSLSEIGSV